MKIELTNHQITFLKNMIQRKYDINASGPWQRITNILKEGFYYDDKSSYNIPATLNIQTDRKSLNEFIIKYKKRNNI